MTLLPLIDVIILYAPVSERLAICLQRFSLLLFSCSLLSHSQPQFPVLLVYLHWEIRAKIPNLAVPLLSSTPMSISY